MLSAKIKCIENKITDITNLATTIILNAKTNDVKGKIPDIINLGTTVAVTAVENKIPNVNNLVKKLTAHKINEIERKLLIRIVINLLLHNN